MTGSERVRDAVRMLYDLSADTYLKGHVGISSLMYAFASEILRAADDPDYGIEVPWIALWTEPVENLEVASERFAAMLKALPSDADFERRVMRMLVTAVRLERDSRDGAPVM